MLEVIEMAGVKGKSGGPRENSGGAREGAGRPPKEPVSVGRIDPKEFLEQAMAGEIDPSPAQVAAAKTLFAHKYPKADASKKETRQKVAEETTKTSVYSPAKAPAAKSAH